MRTILPTIHRYSSLLIIFMQISALSSAPLVASVFDDNAVNTERPVYQWTVNVKVADNAPHKFTGGIEADIVFNDYAEYKFMLPLQDYEPGQKYGFKIDLPSEGNVQYVVLRTVSLCSNSLPIDVLYLDWAEFRSQSRKSTYFKRLNNVAIKDKCQKQRGTVLIDFEEMAAKKCEVNGKVYNYGDSWDNNCVGRCRCYDGRIGCVDMCGPFAWRPMANQTCQIISINGQCCPSLLCVDQNGQKIRPKQNTTNSECRLKQTGLDIKQAAYPSMVYICDEHCEDQSKARPAVILNSKWVITTFGDDTPNVSQMFIHIPHENTDNDKKAFEVAAVVQRADKNFMLLQAKDYLPNTLNVQQTNLPATEAHCRKLTSNNCPVVIPQISLNAKGVLTFSALSRGAVTSGLDISSVDARLQSLCPWSKNEPLFVYDGEIDYIVGLNNSPTNTAQNVQQWSFSGCNLKEVNKIVNICSSIDWIKQNILNL